MNFTKSSRVTTRDRKHEVEILATDMGGEFPLLARLRLIGSSGQWQAARRNSYGHYHCDGTHNELDLIELPPQVVAEKYVTLWPDGDIITARLPSDDERDAKTVGRIRLTIEGDELISVEVVK